jgi:hypothetical protein
LIEQSCGSFGRAPKLRKGSGYALQSFFSCLKKSISAPIPHAAVQRFDGYQTFLKNDITAHCLPLHPTSKKSTNKPIKPFINKNLELKPLLLF